MVKWSGIAISIITDYQIYFCVFVDIWSMQMEVLYVVADGQ